MKCNKSENKLPTNHRQASSDSSHQDEVVKANGNLLHQKLATIKKEKEEKKHKPRGYQGL